MKTYRTLHTVGTLAPETEIGADHFDRIDAANDDPKGTAIKRLLDVKAVEEIGGSSAPEETKDAPKLSEARKDAKDQKERADKLEAELKDALGTLDRAKAHVATLPQDQAEAFRAAVNVEDPKAGDKPDPKGKK